MDFKLGLLPPRPDAITLKMGAYLTTKLPALPKVFGHQSLLAKRALGMLGNDTVGDCVFAGAGHETMLANAMGGRTVDFNTKGVLADYSKVTGYRPSDPSTDRGTDMELAAKFRRKTGVQDAAGHRHLVAAYVDVTSAEVGEAAYLFGSAGVGIRFPSSAMDQFNAGQPWDVVREAQIDGGHYVPLVGRDTSGDWLVITWGKVQRVTARFLTEYMDQGIAYLSEEALIGGRSVEGFNLEALRSDLAAL